MSAAGADDGVVVDARGNEVMRNATGERFRGARHADALVEDAMRTLREINLNGGLRAVTRSDHDL